MFYFKKFSILIFTITVSYFFLININNGQQNGYAEAHSIEHNNYSASFKNKDCTIYKWFDPNTNEKEGKLLLKNCSSCHRAYYKEWVDDKHSMAHNNTVFLSAYKQFKKDHPDKNGNCSLCHNPEAALDNKFDADIRKAKKTNGISCDFCHKIEDVDQNLLKKGVSGLVIKRICKGESDVRFGAIKDPVQIELPDGRESKEELKYNSLYKTSLVCAKCHDGVSGNIQTYSTFTEWVNSPAAMIGIQCQSCHMQPRRENKENSFEIVDNPDVKHKIRPYYEVHSHSFLTEDKHTFRKKYIDLKIKTEQISNSQQNVLVVKVRVENNNPGHSFPTGATMRNAVLVLEVKDKNGNDLKLLKGLMLPDYAGNLKGKPGKLFAKILEETSGQYAIKHGKQGIEFRKIANVLGIPAQDWWNVFIASDSRIKAGDKDISVFEFDLGDVLDKRPYVILSDSEESPDVMRSFIVNTHQDDTKHQIIITAKLIWRNTWHGLAKANGLRLEEDLLIEKKSILN